MSAGFSFLMCFDGLITIYYVIGKHVRHGNNEVRNNRAYEPILLAFLQSARVKYSDLYRSTFLMEDNDHFGLTTLLVTLGYSIKIFPNHSNPLITIYSISFLYFYIGLSFFGTNS